MTDLELLEAWSSRRDESAFAELVRRHLDLVYASALRQVRDAALAKDIAQAVFLVLSRKAGSLGPGVILSGWLFRTTRFVAARAVRAEQRRVHHEHQATMQPPDTETAPLPEQWTAVEPHLDAALAALSESDRRAVLLRFLENQPLRQVGERLGVGEEAAKKRVSRAVEKLRNFLSHRGVALTVAALTTLLLNLPAGAAPVGLSTEISAAVIGNSVAPASMGLAAGAQRDQFLARLLQSLPWAAAALVVLVAGGVFWTQLSEPTPATVADPAPATPTQAAQAPATKIPETPPLPAQPGPSRILINVRAADDNRALVARGMALFWTRREPVRRQEVNSDSQGNLEIPAADPNIHQVSLWLSVPGYVPVHLRWQQHEFVEPLLLYTCRMQRGQTLRGTVHDEAGHPVAGARIQFHSPGMDLSARENIDYFDALTSVISDEAGRYATDQLPLLVGRNTMRYSVSHPDYVRVAVDLLSPETLRTNHVVILRTGHFVHGHVYDGAGTPLADAKVQEEHNYNLPTRKTKSSGDGTFILGPFAPGPLKIAATAGGFSERAHSFILDKTTPDIDLALEPKDGNPSDGEDHMAQAKPIRITGDVRDAESGDPLKLFRVLLDEQTGGSTSLVGEGHDGHFDWPMEIPFAQNFSLLVEADGYEPMKSDQRSVKDESSVFEIRMRRGGQIAGLVLDPGGRPVTGALVGLNGVGFGFIIGTDGRAFSGNDAPQTVTDANGRFALPRAIGAQTVLVAHDSGWAFVPLAEVARTALVLKPWGAIEGTLRVGGEPAAGKMVTLAASLPEEDSAAAGIEVQGNTTTDNRGRFRFERVPGGKFQVSRYFNFNRTGLGPVGIGAATPVTVTGGEVAEVTVSGVGRAIIGRLALSRALAGFEWRDDLQQLVQIREDLPPPPPDGFPGKNPQYIQNARAWARWQAQTGKHFLTIQPDGSFRIDDVPPGRYSLKLRVKQPPAPGAANDDDNYNRTELGQLERSVTIPENTGATEPLDLGTLVIPLRQP